MRKRAYLHCRPMVLREVGRSYLKLADEVLRDRTLQPRPLCLPEPLLTPRPEEREGYVPNVVYTCGALIHGRS